MPIGISDDHRELAASVREWARSMETVAAVRAAEADPGGLGSWPARYAELGLASIALPEEVGGGGGTLLDQAVALEAAAYELVPGPLLGTTVGGLLYDDPALRKAIVAGSACVGLGPPSVELELVGGRLQGGVPAVLDALSVTHVSLTVEDGASSASWLVPVEQLDVVPGPSIDLSRTVGRVGCEALDMSGHPIRNDGPYPPPELVVLAAAEASGVAQWCLDTAVAYARTREQFGRPIGGFQAVKHLCAEMLETTESVTAAAWDAARAAQEGPEQAAFAAAVAGAVCFDGAVEVAKSCIQVLGGIGFTFEHDAHLYLRRALALRAWVGASRLHADRLTELAQGGVRRDPRIDLPDDGRREQVREQVQRIAALPQDEQRAALAESGLLMPHWPAPYGRDAEPAQQLVIEEELAASGVQRPDLKIGGWAAPTILAHGSAQQRERFVAATLRGDLEWCQLFSEPGAGSDLASLRTRATRDGEGWRLTGQKVWSSLAHRADWAICLARTDPDAAPHAGITYFLVDMTSPGLDIRPLRELTGETMFNEVFLDEVLVPDDCVVGGVGGGWRLARTTLANERVAMAGSSLGVSVERALKLLDAEPSPEAGAEVGRAVAWATVVKLLGVRATLWSIAGQGPGAESSVAKLVGVRSRQDAAELVAEMLGTRMFTDDDLAREAVHELLLTRCLSIAGGTTQVLRNVAGERLLGLPRG